MSKAILGKTQAGEIQLTVTIPWMQVVKAADQAVEEIGQETILPGFRKGKAPKDLIKQKVGKEKIYEKVVQIIVPQAYEEAVKEHNLKPIVFPKIEMVKAEEENDWVFRAITAERPEVNLDNYKEKVRKSLAPKNLRSRSELWTPEKGKPQAEEKGPTLEEKTQAAISALLDSTPVILPSMLVEEEVNRSLSNLINQTASLGLTVEQYLTSIGKSADALRAEYRQKVETELKLQFILDEIAQRENIEVSEKEIEDLIAASGDEKVKQNLRTPLQKSFIKGILRRRKALDFLGTLS